MICTAPSCILFVVLCPNDASEMRPVKVESHYGQPIVLDQCATCGGIWFDESELFRARQGEAEKMESLDAAALRSPSEIASSTLTCPRDGARLFRFSDRYFPEDIVLQRCPSCRGLWLNRGVFTEYQRKRQARLRRREVFVQPDGSTRDAEGAPAVNVGRSGTELAGKIGRFLSMELDPGTMQPMDPRQVTPEEQKALETTMGVLTSLLSLFAFR